MNSIVINSIECKNKGPQGADPMLSQLGPNLFPALCSLIGMTGWRHDSLWRDAWSHTNKVRQTINQITSSHINSRFISISSIIFIYIYISNFISNISISSLRNLISTESDLTRIRIGCFPETFSAIAGSLGLDPSIEISLDFPLKTWIRWRVRRKSLDEMLSTSLSYLN